MFIDNDEAILRQLRKIRDGVEVIASTVVSLFMLVICFAEFLFPRPEGWWAWLAFFGCLSVGATMARAIRDHNGS